MPPLSSSQQFRRQNAKCQVPSAAFSTSIICLCRICVLLHGQLFDAASAQLIHVCTAIWHAVDPSFEPGIAVCFCFRLLVILAEESIVAIVVALHRGWMRAVGTMHHRAHHESGDDRAIGIARDYFRLNDFFRHNDDPFGGTNTLEHHAEVAPAVGVSIAVGALHMDDSDIRIQRTYCPQWFLGSKRREYLIEKMIFLGHIAA